MPSANFLTRRAPPAVVQLAPVKTIADARVFMETRTGNTHQLGSDPKKVLARLRQKGRFSFVLRSSDGVAVGTASITETEPAIGVVGIAILPAFQRRGLAAAALREIEKFAAQKGFIALRADIFDDNHAATGLFTREGYRRYSLFEKAI